MKVILKKSDPKLGEEDSVVDVSAGHARNYLFPRKIAVLATEKEIASAEKRKEEKDKIVAQKKEECQALAKKFESMDISIPADAGEGGKLFGSVTAQDIADALHNDIDKKKIELEEPIKALGEYKVLVKLFPEVSATLKIKVVAK